jgi:hypothetical protein
MAKVDEASSLRSTSVIKAALTGRQSLEIAPETLALGFELFEGGDEVVQALPFLFDHWRRSARDEARVGEFGFRLADLALRRAISLSSRSHSTARSIWTCSISRVSPTMAIGALASAWQIVDDLHF